MLNPGHKPGKCRLILGNLTKQIYLTMSKTYLSNFFLEKEIPYQLFEITDSEGLTHFIDTEVVTEAIFNASSREQQVITQTLRKLDFHNQPIGEYLKFLATVLVSQFNNSL